ncbi:MAG TPA: glycosyltransferase 87 family protein, partial [Edaphobacter sp.]
MRLPSLLRQFLAQSLVWTALCLLTESVCGFILHWGFPYNYPAPPATSIFDDFRLYISRFAYFRTPRFFESIPPYPAPASVLYKLFLLPQPTHIRFAVFRYILAILITSWVMLFAFRRALIRHGLAPRSASFFVLGTYLFSYPLWFEVHQANLEFITWGLVTGGLAAYWLKRNRLAAVLLGLAAAIKIVPVLLLGLFLAQKQYRALALALATTALFTLLSLWIWYPDIAYSWHASSVALKGITDMSALQLLLVHSGFDHSLFSLFKRLLPVLPPPAQLAPLLTGYQALTAVAGCILFFVRIRHLPLINQILCLSVAVTLFPPVSYDYTL